MKFPSLPFFKRRSTVPQGDLQPPQMVGAAALPTPETPRVRGRQETLPSYLTTATPNPDSAVPLTDRRLFNTDLLNLRTGLNTRQVIRDFVRASPDLSAAVTAYVRTGITSGYTAVAKNPDGTFNPDATNTLHQVITRMNILNDYTLGFDDSLSIRSVSETWARDLLMTGAMSGELVLNKALLPDKLQPISTQQIKFYPSRDGKKLRPVQVVGGEEIDLDKPTFFMVSLDQDTFEAYPVAPIEPAIQAVMFSIDFVNDIRRIVKRSIHPRMDVVIDSEKIRKGLPIDVTGDQAKLNDYLTRMIQDLESRINNLTPEEALVHFDEIGIEIIDHGNTNLSNEYTVIEKIINSKLAAGTKTLPTVLGQSGGTSNVASSEVLIFMKYVEGTIWAKLNEMFSKMLTLAVRLLGQDVYVEFAYNAIDLRPEMELESFKAMRQSRYLELLSCGFISDEECSVALTGHLPRPGHAPLAGTGFRANTSVQPAGDGYNGASNSGSTMNQNLKPDTPTETKSPRRAEGTVVPLAAQR